MKKTLAAALLALTAGSAFAGTAPTILSACSMQIGNTISISGMLSDPDNDAVSVAPLVVGVCVNGILPNYVYPASYNCNVPAGTGAVTLVAADSEGNFSAGAFVDLSSIPQCFFY